MNKPKLRTRNYLVRDKFIRVSKSLNKKLGLEAAVLIGEMIEWEYHLEEKGLLEEDNSFYMTHDYIEERTGLSQHKQQNARNVLEKEGMISWERRGIPSKYFYIINHDKVEEAILGPAQSLKSSPTSDRNSRLLYKEPKGIELEPKIQEELRSSSLIDSSAFRNESSLDIVVPLKRRAITTPIVFESQSRRRYRKDIVDIVTYWNSSPGLSRIRTPFNDDSNPTKTFESVVKTIQGVLKGNYFNSVGLSKYEKVYTKEELITTIDRFKLMATNPSYLPTRKDAIRKVGLGSFFYNPYSNGVPSYFIKCLEEEPKHVTSNAKPREDNTPGMTKLMKEIYVDLVLSGEMKTFNRSEENKFIEGGEKLQKFIRRVQPRINMITSLTQWGEYFINSLVEKWGVSQIYPGHLCADHSFNDVFVRYLKNKGRID